MAEENEGKSVGSRILKDAVVSGDIHTKCDVRLEGCVRGNIRCSSMVTVAEGAEVGGNVQCRDLHADGMIRGNVEADGEVFLDENAVILGHVVASRLVHFPNSVIKKGLRLRDKEERKPIN